MAISNHFDDTSINRKGTKEFPFLLLDKPTNELTLLIQSLPLGTLPLVIRHNDKLIKVREIARDPIVIDRILRTGRSIDIYLTETNHVKVDTITELIELSDFTWTD